MFYPEVRAIDGALTDQLASSSYAGETKPQHISCSTRADACRSNLAGPAIAVSYMDKFLAVRSKFLSRARWFQVFPFTQEADYVFEGMLLRQSALVDLTLWRSSFFLRNLQNIVIDYPEGENSGNPNTDLEANDGSYRSKTIIVCQNLPEAMSQRLDVSIQYIVETDTEDADIPESFLDEEIPKLVAEQAISSVADSICIPLDTQANNDDDDDQAGRDEEPTTEETPDNHARSFSASYSGSRSVAGRQTMDESKPSGRSNGKGNIRLLSVNSDCILSVSSGAPGQRSSSCNPSLPASASCDIFDDTISILHTGDCSDEEIIADVLSAISQGIGSSDFLSSVNEKSQESGVTVTLIELFDGNDDQVLAGITTGQAAAATGMSAGGKAAMACLALVALFVASALYARRRTRSLDDGDEKSVHTQWSNKTDDNSYLKPDYHDLLFRHSKLDVHKCKSALCEVCQPQLGLVHTVRVPKGTNVLTLRLDGTEQEVGAVGDDFEMESCSSRRSLEPLGDLEPITRDHIAAIPSGEKGSEKSAWFSFGRGKHKCSEADEAMDVKATMEEEEAFPTFAIAEDDISFVASSTRSSESAYSREAKEIIL